jgi:hypothetical protein
MNYEILQNADFLVVGATMIPVIVQVIKKRFPKIHPKAITFLVAFAFAQIALMVTVGIEAGSLKEFAVQSLALTSLSWKWADSTYNSVKDRKIDNSK